MNSLFVLLAVQTLVSILLIVWVRMKVMRSLDDGDSIARVRREIGALIVELDGSADRNITVIEDRLQELKDCIVEADKRIVMLSNERVRTWTTQPRQEVPQHKLSGSQDFFSAAPQPAVAPSQPAVAPSQPDQPPVPQAERLQGATPTSSVPFIRFSEKPLVFEEPFAERVARLHKRGFSSDIIAAKLKATIAEVDLAIAAGWDPPGSRKEG